MVKTVMQVALSLDVGGLERVILNLVQNASSEFRLVVCCLERPGAWADQLSTVVAFDKRPGVDWRLFWKIARLARIEHVDVIHTHNSTAHLYGAIAGKLAGVKVLHTEHGKNIGEEARSFRVNRWAERFTDVTVAVSKQIAREALLHEHVAPDRLVVVANGISVEHFRSPRNANGRRIGTVGRLVREKNYPLLFRAFTTIPNAELVVVGDGPLRSELESQAGPLVRFLGQRSDVAALLPGFDVFAVSSSTEGMSIALLEAMAAGCPIVATAVGGNTEVIEHEVTGLLVPPNDETALRAAIVRLLADRTLAARLGKAASDLSRQRYSVAAMTRRYEELWRRLAA
jgi:glycosyltransferase involved in cell wall biosynthesis